MRAGAAFVLNRLIMPILTVCLVAVITMATGNHRVRSASAQGQAPREPLDYFREMMPVFTHDRCTNCHGAVDPSDGRDHPAGQIGPGESCTTSGCHTQADNSNAEREDDWRSAPAAVWFVKLAGSKFVNKDAKELCDQMADRIANFGTTDFIDHLQTDFQIDLGFVGRSGGANTDPQGDPPAMSKTQFLVAAARWVDDGFAACEREGTITRIEEINSDRTYGPTDPGGQGHEVRVKQSGRREVTLQFANGQYQTRVQVTGSVTTTQTIRGEVNGAPCTTIMTSTLNYADVDDPGAQTNLGQSGRAGVEVKLEASGEYTVIVRLGDEKHRQIESASVQDGCGIGLSPSPPETLEQVWPGTSFRFRAKLLNPRDRTRLVGRELKVWFERGESPDDDPWLPDHYAAAAQDGTFHPVDIKTTWNLRYLPR